MPRISSSAHSGIAAQRVAGFAGPLRAVPAFQSGPEKKPEGVFYFACLACNFHCFTVILSFPKSVLYFFLKAFSPITVL